MSEKGICTTFAQKHINNYIRQKNLPDKRDYRVRNIRNHKRKLLTFTTQT